MCANSCSTAYEAQESSIPDCYFAAKYSLLYQSDLASMSCLFLSWTRESILDSTMAIIIIIYRLCYYGLERYILWGLNLSLNVGVLDHKISRICLYSCSDRYYWVVFLNMVLSYAFSGRLVTCYELGDKKVIFIEPDTIAFITSLL